MAKITGLLDNKPVPTSINGIFVKDIPAKMMEEKFGDVEKRIADDPEGMIALFFTDLIVDDNGEPFEDCQTYDEIVAVLSQAKIIRILNAVAEALQPGIEASKK